jgi:DNA (cytosine-5)-methyltransferase 1
VVDLFAGGGGLSLGFAAAGAHVVLAVEANKWAAATHEANHPETVVLNEEIDDSWDIRSRLGESVGARECEILIGGPPCQGWSTLGHRARDERRQAMNAGVRLFLRQVELLHPPAVLMENVRGLAVKEGGRHLHVAENRLRSAGYRVTTWDVRAADFRVPQLRHRLFLVGIRDDLGLDFNLQVTCPKKEWLSVWDAIGDLPSLGAGGRSDTYACAPKTALQERLRRGSTGLSLHEAPDHSTRIRAILSALHGEGSSRSDLKDGLELTSGFHNTYCRLRSDEPAPAVTSSAGRVSSGRNAHPFDDRALTPREAARLQTFPDAYHWVGPGRWSIYEQIGNAVPPVLAEAVARQLLSLLAPTLGHVPEPTS